MDFVLLNACMNPKQSSTIGQKVCALKPPKKIVLHCTHCGISFTKYQSKLSPNQKKTYCTQKCRDSAEIKRVTKVCVECGTTVVRKQADAHRSSVCSIACKRTFTSKLKRNCHEETDQSHPLCVVMVYHSDSPNNASSGIADNA